jgi:hypothetical protein
LKTWVVRQFSNEYNPTHWHGGHISGAGFLKVPKSLGPSTPQKKSKQYRRWKLTTNTRRQNGYLSLHFLYTPEVGGF